jgi:hypothetical protein
MVGEYGFLVSAATYWKVPFEWTDAEVPAEDAVPDAFSWVTGDGISKPVGLVANVLWQLPSAPKTGTPSRPSGAKKRRGGHSRSLRGSPICPSGGMS